MFFSAKKLLAQKQQLNDKIHAEREKMNLAYLDLTEALRKFYFDYECFDMFDITVVDYWFGRVACCYDGENFDLSDAFFRMNEQLSDVEAETLSTQQLIGIYNIFTVLINDMYGKEETILTQTEISKQTVLDNLKILTEKMIASLNNDQSTWAEKLSIAIQKLYTLLDFSLYDSPRHRNLRHLKDQYLQLKKAGYDRIKKFEREQEEINKKLEKHNYSKEGKKISKKEFAPFPTLKAYNNAMLLLGRCLMAAEEYESEGNPLVPSCLDDIGEVLIGRFTRAKDEFDEWEDDIDFEKVAHTMLANATFDMLASGRYHLYAGILNPLNCSSKLMLVYDKSMAYGVRIGMVTLTEKEEQHNYLLKRISEVG